jgi:hypothetical protein
MSGSLRKLIKEFSFHSIYHRCLIPLLIVIALILLMPACEKESNHPITPHDYVFNWEQIKPSPDLEYFQPLPPFTIGDNGEMWSCGYMISGSFNYPTMARYTDAGWMSYGFISQAYDSYAYDIKMQPGNNQVWTTIKLPGPFGGEGIYRFASELIDPEFIIVQQLPDPGMLDFYDQTHGVMITRHLDQTASALWLFDGQNWTSQSFFLAEIPGEVIDISTYGNDYLTYAITSDHYVVRWSNQYLNFVEFSIPLYSIKMTGVDEGWLCADNGLYHKTADTSWIKEGSYPGDRAYSLSFAGGKMWIAGEKDGAKKVWKREDGVYEEESTEGTGTGRLIMVPQQSATPYHGFILEDLRLLERKWEVQ